MLYAGGWAPEHGRFRRLENLEPCSAASWTARSPPALRPPRRCGAGSPSAGRRIRDGLLAAIDWRTDDPGGVAGAGARPAAGGRAGARIAANFAQFAATLRGALAEDERSRGRAVQPASRSEKSKEELAQYRRDRRSWEDRLTGLAAERDRELDAIAARYRDPQPHRFPVAVVFVVPRREAIR